MIDVTQLDKLQFDICDWNEVEKEKLDKYIKDNTCFNCGGHNIKYFRGEDELNNTRILIVCQDCGKVIACDCMDGIKM